MDNDTIMLEKLGNALVDLQVKYRNSSLEDRMAMKPALEELLSDYADYQLRLLKEGVITTDDDLLEMDSIKKEIDQAARKEQLIVGIAKLIAFIAKTV